MFPTLMVDLPSPMVHFPTPMVHFPESMVVIKGSAPKFCAECKDRQSHSSHEGFSFVRGTPRIYQKSAEIVDPEIGRFDPK